MRSTFVCLFILYAPLTANAHVTGLSEPIKSLRSGVYPVSVASGLFRFTPSVEMHIHVPKSISGERNRPVIVFFHGNTRDKKYYRIGDKFLRQKAKKHRFILISAQQWWSLNGGKVSGIEDSRMAVNQVLHILAGWKIIDAGQVYAVGFSAGGFAAFLTVMNSLDHHSDPVYMQMQQAYWKSNAESEGKIFDERRDLRAESFANLGGVEMQLFPYRGFASFKGNFYRGDMAFPIQIEDWKAHYRTIFQGRKAYVSVGGKKDADRVRTQAPALREFFDNYLGLHCDYFEYPDEGHVLTEKNWSDFWSLTGLQ